MEIKIIQHTGTEGIVEAMKTSRRKSNIENVPGKIFNWGHFSLLEHSSMTIHVSGISRSMSHQLVRQRIGVTFTQESQRYFDPIADKNWFVIPQRIQKNESLKQKFILEREREANEYKSYLDAGIPKEDARFCLSNSCKTSVTWTFNMTSLIWFLEQRMDKAAQWEIRKFANELYEKIIEIPEWAEFLKHWELGRRR